MLGMGGIDSATALLLGALLNSVVQALALRLPPLRTPPLPLPGSARPTLYQLFLARTSWHPSSLVITYIAFIEPAPSAAAPSFTVAGWPYGTLHQSCYIIVDSFQEHLESGERARPQSLERSRKCRAGDLVVVGCSTLCCRSPSGHPKVEKQMFKSHDLNFITDNMSVSLVNLK